MPLSSAFVTRLAKGHVQLLILAPLLLMQAGCLSLFSRLPPEREVPARIAEMPQVGLPLKEAVTVRWSDDLVPFIEARNDHDAAVAIGVVHAHLRLGQMELLRRVAKGQLALGAGPLVTDIDRALRILDLGRAAPAMWANMDATTKAWVEAYCSGVNGVIAHLKANPESTELPIEHRVLAYPLEEWTPIDVLSVGRLAAVDINWITWLSLLLQPESPERDAFENRVRNMSGVPSTDRTDPLRIASRLAHLSRSGSNALVVHGSRSDNGHPLLAADPHLGIFAPNTWMLVGWSTPSNRVTGLSIPGIPFIAIGRNNSLAWGGTNMRTWSSDLFRLNDEQVAAAVVETEPITVRWWLDSSVTRRVTPWGPIITDIGFLKEKKVPPMALKWLGHETDADEMSALLRMNRAQTVNDAHQALEGYRVSGQTMLFADNDGDIAQILMAGIPKRKQSTDGTWLRTAGDANHEWQGIWDPTVLPMVTNPNSGWIGSANNPPLNAIPRLGFASESERIRRITELMDKYGSVTINDIKAMQQDVVSPASRDLANLVTQSATPSAFADLIADWDGSFASDSRPAMAMEWFMYHLVQIGYRDMYGEDIAKRLGRTSFVREWLHEDVKANPEQWAPHIAAATKLVEEDLEDHPEDTWGDHHRLRIAHPFANFPLIGDKYRFAEFPTGGGTTTLNKTASSLSNESQTVTYGANARFIADLSDIDNTWVILLGGQDGRLNSEATWNQVERWQAGEYLPLPLSEEGIRELYTHEIPLKP